MILLDPGSAEKDGLDQKIIQAQAKAKIGEHSAAQVEVLGWLFVQKARVSNDPGYYKLAEQCANCLSSVDSNSLDALLLRGHVLHSLHRFAEAEPIALRLTAQRGRSFDFGLLGDVEYDEGNVDKAVAAYQQMVNLHPELQAYSRIAQVRWITGDLPGAVAMMKYAAASGSPLNAEPTAWTYARLALFELQSHDLASAQKSARIALQLESNNAAALMALGRVQWVAGQTNDAVNSVRSAAALNHLPETQWLLADMLRASGREAEAEPVEKELQNRGAGEDPRSFSLYLATRHTEPALALHLAEKEMKTRQDVFTHDALAWAFYNNGRIVEAQAESKKVFVNGTRDARLYFHRAMIEQAAGDKNQSSRFAQMAWNCRQMLFPSELEQLNLLQPLEELNQRQASNLQKN